MNNLPQFICAGEALTDLIRTGEEQWHSLVGGSTWNVARSLSRLGNSAQAPLPFHTAFAGAISQDCFGDALFAASEAAQLDLRFIQRYAKSPLLAIVAQSSPPDYFFVGDDSADLYFQPETLPQGWQSQLQWAHFGGISLARPPLSHTLITLAQSLKQRGVKISYDPNFRKLMDESYDITLRQMCELADVIKVSDEDVRGLFRRGDADAALQQLRALNPNAVLLYTCGAQGATLFNGEQSWQLAPPNITVIDSVGAGDASIAGLLFSLHAYPERAWPFHLAFSVASGAAACLAAGAQAPDLSTILPLFEQLISN